MHLFSLTCDELAAVMRERWGKGSWHAAEVCRSVFKQGRTAFAETPGLTPALADRLQQELDTAVPDMAAVIEQDGTAKIVFSLADGLRVESVLIAVQRRSTLCISCQAGCRMGCRICRTGDMGLYRNLGIHEIVGQVWAVRFGLGRRVDNIVFMGMGEPLDNFANVAQAIRVLSDQRGLDIAHSRITLSTVGLPDGIRRLGRLNWPRLNLAVSLNAARDTLRSQLMPVNQRYPLARLKQALQNYPLRKNGVFFIEYVLVQGVNDARSHAAELAGFLEELPVRVNVIGYNPGSRARFKSPSEEEIRRFCGLLAQQGVFVRMRSSRGRSAWAACGQLGEAAH